MNKSLIFILLFLFSCNYNKPKVVIKDDFAKYQQIIPESKASQKLDESVFFEVDDYPITKEMLIDKSKTNHKIQSGESTSIDKVWFCNDALNQSLIFELYTDYHRLGIFHFYKDAVPKDIIRKVELINLKGNISSENQKLKDFEGFLKQAKNIPETFFISRKGIKLGDSKEKAIAIYGKPNMITLTEGYEKLEWDFNGDQNFNSQKDTTSKLLAKNSFGHQAMMYFKENNLMAYFLHNDIP